MNIYKNLMFLHGHFVDPRDADDEAAPAPAAARTEPAPAAASRRPQASSGAIWRTWLRLWPSETAKVEVDCDARGCA
ncbi:hypothetical protein [Lysobacter sp. CA199]|uniref:hypothetical protein n=1 Tax=Lysobacter sp. CA199 TaxID=3455608 RepID=UPI003F8D5CB9